MGNASFWVVEGMLCVPLGLLVWASQRVYNGLLPSRRALLLGRVLPRAIVLLVLLVATCLMASCLFVAAALSAPDWPTRWSGATLWQALAEGWGLAMSLVVVCVYLGRIVRARRVACAYVPESSREQEDLS